MTEAEKKAIEMVELFRQVVLYEWEAKKCARVHIEKLLDVEKKYSNYGEYEFLKTVETEINKL